MIRPSIRFGALAAAVLGGLAVLAGGVGCTEAYRPSPPMQAVDNPLPVATMFDPLFEATTRTLRDHRFEIFRQDPRLGQVVTHPLTGQQPWEIGRSDAFGLYNQLESGMHTILRTVDVRIFPARDAEGNRLPDQFYLEVRAYTERLSVPERELTLASQLPRNYAAGEGLIDAMALEREGIAEVNAVYLGRDSWLENALIRGILRRIGHAIPTAPSGEQGISEDQPTMVR